VITVTNTGDGNGSIVSIVDTLDSKVEDSFVIDEFLSTGGEYTDGVITWNFIGSDAIFDPGESKMYQYKLVIPRANFGGYGNTAVATPTVRGFFLDFF